MRRFLAVIRRFLDSLLLERMKPWKRSTEEDFIRTIFECLRNTALCGLVLGVGVWLDIKSSGTVFYLKLPSVLLEIVSGLFLGLNIIYFDLKLRRLEVRRIVWWVAMVIFVALNSFLYVMVVILK
jgi:hypothetical protein